MNYLTIDFGFLLITDYFHEQSECNFIFTVLIWKNLLHYPKIRFRDNKSPNIKNPSGFWHFITIILPRLTRYIA